MNARMQNPATLVPGALDGLLAVATAARSTGLPERVVGLVQLRASQINGCGVCVDMHARELRHAGESDQRIDTVAGWRDASYFADDERAALELTEAATRIADRGDVPQEVFDAAADHFDEKQMAGLVLQIALINAFNRVNVATRQVAGDWIADLLRRQAS